ncbi:MAG: ThiF family adenylyltransferase [Planctomycetota bacterium]
MTGPPQDTAASSPSDAPRPQLDAAPAGHPFYARQVRLPQVGPQGQARLAQSTAAVLGCGALGSVVAQWLARAGVGTLILIDRDVVEPSNLQRQLLYDRQDAEQGLAKVEAACRQIARVNPQVRVLAHACEAGPDSIERLCGLTPDADGPRADILIDGFDSYRSRFVASDCAMAHGVPLVHGGAVGTVGSMCVVLPALSRLPDQDQPPPWLNRGGPTADLAEMFGEPPPPGSTPTCESAGVLGPAVGVVASLQAAEAIKILLGDWPAVSRDLWRIDLWAGQIDRFRTPEPALRSPEDLDLPYLRTAVGPDDGALCGRDVVQVSPAVPGASVDLERLGQRWKIDHGDRVMASPFLARLTLPEGQPARALTVFRDGRTLVHGAADAPTARAVVDRFVGG